MPMTIYLVIGLITTARTTLRVAERWIQSCYQFRLAREYDRTLIDALKQIRAGYGLEHHGPDGSQWLVTLSSPGRLDVREVAR